MDEIPVAGEIVMGVTGTYLAVNFLAHSVPWKDCAHDIANATSKAESWATNKVEDGFHDLTDGLTSTVDWGAKGLDSVVHSPEKALTSVLDSATHSVSSSVDSATHDVASTVHSATKTVSKTAHKVLSALDL
jgi:hypothetical protein